MKMPKYVHVKLVIVLFLVMVLFVSSQAFAEENKGALIRLWERFTSRTPSEEKAPSVKKDEVVELKEEPEEKVAEKAPVEKAPEKAPVKEKEKLSRGEMIDTIRRRLGVFSEIIDMIPGLSLKKSAEGEEEYYYAPSGSIPMRLEEIEMDALDKLYVQVNRQSTIMHTERINRQIRQQEQIMRLQELRRVPQKPTTPTVSQPYVPPQPPRQVQTPPRIPSVPEQRR